MVSRVRAQSGQSAVEYLGVMAVIAVVIAALAASSVGENLRAAITNTVCDILNADCGAELAGEQVPLTDADFRPDWCETTSTAYSGEVGADVLFFDASTGVQFSRTERSDGTTEFTVVDNSEVGAALEGPGATVEAGPLKGELKSEIRAGLTAEEGETWGVPTDQADDLEDALLADQTIGDGGIMGWIGDRLRGEAPDPDKTFVAAGGEVSAEASAGAEVLGENVAGGNAAIQGGVQLGEETDTSSEDPAEHTKTDYIQVDGSVSGNLGVGTIGVGAERGATNILKISRDLDGNLTGIEIVDSTQGTALGEFGSQGNASSTLVGSESTSVVEKTKIDLDSAEDRAATNAWLQDGDAEAFQQLAQREAEVSLTEHEGDEFGLALGAKVAFGAKLGLRGEIGRTTSQLTDAYYRGAPENDGVREWRPFGECLQAAGG